MSKPPRPKLRPKSNPMSGQMSFDIPPEAPPPPTQTAVPRLPPGKVLVRHVELGPDDFRQLVAASDHMSKDNEDAVVDGFAAAMRDGVFDPNGDTFVLLSDGSIIEGLKRARAAIKAGTALRALVVQGVDPEARFSTDDHLKTPQHRRIAPKAPPLPPLEPIDLARLPKRDAADVQAALALIRRANVALGYDAFAHLNREALARAGVEAGPLSGLGTPRHQAIIAAACVAEIAPGHAKGFMTGWAMPAVSPPSAARSLAKSPLAERSGKDELDLLAAVALAIEAYVDGVDADPYELLATTKRTKAQLLQVLGGRPGHLPDRLVSCAEETLDVGQATALLAFSDRPIGDWDDAEIERIQPLVRDVRRNRGLVLTGQTIKITHGGRLIDGFDRVAACVLAGLPVRSFVSRGFREDFNPNRPRGRKQGLGHRLYADGYTNPWDVQAMLANVHRMTENDRGAVVTNTLMRHLHRTHPQAQKTVMFVHELKSRVLISAIAPAHLALSRYSRDLADSFFAELRDIWNGTYAATLPRHTVLTALIAKLEEIRPPDVEQRDREADDPAETISYVIEAMNAWCAERPVITLRAPPPRGYARLDMPPQVRQLQERAKAEKAERAAVAAPAAP